MDISLTIKEIALDILAWLQVDEGSVRVKCENSLNDELQHYRVEVSASNASLLIGKHGDTLAAFQHLLRIFVARKADKDEKYQIRVDVDGYRERKIEQTIELALRRAEKVQTAGGVERLPPMDAFMRRAVHLRIAEDFVDLTTESVGQGKFKILTIKQK